MAIAIANKGNPYLNSADYLGTLAPFSQLTSPSAQLPFEVRGEDAVNPSEDQSFTNVVGTLQ